MEVVSAVLVQGGAIASTKNRQRTDGLSMMVSPCLGPAEPTKFGGDLAPSGAWWCVHTADQGGKLWLGLVAQEFLMRRTTSRFAEREYAFRHALMREDVHAMLTERDRRLGHKLAFGPGSCSRVVTGPRPHAKPSRQSPATATPVSPSGFASRRPC